MATETSKPSSRVAAKAEEEIKSGVEAMAKAVDEDVNANDIRSELDQLRSDISSLTKTVSSYGAAKANQYANLAADKKAELGQAHQEIMGTAKKELDHMEGELKSRIRDKPLQAIGIAAGIGFVLAVLTRR